MNPLLARMMAESMQGDEGASRSKLAPDMEAIRLRDALAALNVRHHFEAGMIVQQKREVRQYKNSGDNDLAIVVEVLPVPIVSENREIGSNGFAQMVDIKIGSIEQGPHGEIFAVSHVDSSRYEPVPEAELGDRD